MFHSRQMARITLTKPLIISWVLFMFLQSNALERMFSTLKDNEIFTINIVRWQLRASLGIKFSHSTSIHQHSFYQQFFCGTDAGKIWMCSPWCHQSLALRTTGVLSGPWCCPKNCHICSFNHGPCRKANYSNDTCKHAHKYMHRTTYPVYV